LAADPGMYFHQIFNVFRIWLLGAYLLGDKKVLGQLLRVHRFDKGLWRGYGRCFQGLVDADKREINLGLRMILKIEHRPDDLGKIPGLELVHLPALAIARLARLKNIEVAITDRRLPMALLKW
jgi:hypothetical protein